MVMAVAARPTQRANGPLPRLDHFQDFLKQAPLFERAGEIEQNRPFVSR